MNTKLKTVILIFSFASMAFTGYLMYSRFLAEEFWGYWPILLWASFWIFIVIATESRYSRHPKKWRLLGLSTLTGLLLSLGFPPVPLTSLMFVAFVPLLIVEKEISNFREEPSKWEVFKYSYHAFVIWNIFACYWVTNTAFVAAFLAIFINPLLMTIPFVLFHQAGKRLNQKMKWTAFVAFWIAFEYVHQRHQLSWPWLTLGNSFAQFPSWVQWYSFTGVFGGTLWILVSNILFYKPISTWYFNKIPLALKRLVLPFAFVILPILLSLLVYYRYEEQGTQEVEVTVVQPNFEPHYEKFNLPGELQFRRFMELSEKACDDDTDYLLWPETSLDAVNIGNFENDKDIIAIRRFLADHPKTRLVAGVGAYQVFDGYRNTPALRTQVNLATGDTTYWEAYNAAIQVEHGTDEIPVYKKSILVPGAEFLPYRKIFYWLESFVNKLGGTMAGYGAQEDRGVFHSTTGTAVAPVICYESIFGEYMTGYIRNGAQAIFIVTNDGWWDDTAGHKQHLMFASLRAIESRRPVARSANTGISAFINQRGDIRMATQYEEAIAIKDKILLNDSATFYVRWGDLIGRIAGFLSILLILNALVKGWIPEEKIPGKV
jgi:apolipoprotein N-acyltransferase